MSPKKLCAVAPDGTIFSRRTHRTYTHAILVKGSSGWYARTWCGRPDLAAKELAKVRAMPGGVEAFAALVTA